ncbi:MAG: alpha/beta hydrolase [Acidimicrobiales bacterium]
MSSTSSTTTTTLPVAVAGTPLLRARVAPLAPGAAVLTPVTPGSTAWSRMVPIAFQSFGSGPDLLLIEGQDATVSWWYPLLLSDLARHYRVTVFDLPGVGYSGHPTGPLALDWLADMTAGFSLTIGQSDPVVVGWGLGGEIALALAERHPRVASSLVLVDTSCGGPEATPPGAAVTRLLALPGATPEALSTLLFPATASGLLERLIWWKSLFAGTTDWMTAGAIAAEASLQATIWTSRALVDGLSRVTVPVLVVSGDDDIVFPPENAHLLADGLRHATLEIFPGSGYGALIQDEAEFVQAVESFTG